MQQLDERHINVTELNCIHANTQKDVVFGSLVYGLVVFLFVMCQLQERKTPRRTAYCFIVKGGSRKFEGPL